MGRLGRRSREGGSKLRQSIVPASQKKDPPAPSVSRTQVWIDQVQEGEMIRQVRGTGVLVPREVRWIAAQSPGQAELGNREPTGCRARLRLPPDRTS